MVQNDPGEAHVVHFGMSSLQLFVERRFEIVQRIVLSCAALALLGFAAAASGAPIIYNEAIDGDLPNQGTPLNTDPLHTFVFDLGTNTISGTISGGGDPSDHDSFAFVIPPACNSPPAA